MLQIVLRSQFDGRIVSYWRSGRGWHANQPTKFAARAEAERELAELQLAQLAVGPRIFIEPIASVSAILQGRPGRQHLGSTAGPLRNSHGAWLPNAFPASSQTR